jgi:hypothetical protein
LRSSSRLAPHPISPLKSLSFQNQGVEVSGEEIHELLNELDTNHNGQVEVEEYLQVRAPLSLLLVSCVCLLGSSFSSLCRTAVTSNELNA